MTVNKILNDLLNDADQTVMIKGKAKKIIGFAEFRSVNLGADTYHKISFDDHSSMLIVSAEDILFYSNKPPTLYQDISDQDIGNKKELIFANKKFVLENANDYQYVVRLIKGDCHTIEGEVKFSDYVPKDDSNEILSLGWIVRTGQRADVYAKELSLDDISLK